MNQKIIMQSTLHKLEILVSHVPALLRKVPEAEFSAKPSPAKWSKKEILGHLLDSAANNLQRFIRAQFEDSPHIRYAQDDWVKHNHYADEPSEEVISFWEHFHRHLLWVMRNIPEENLERTCSSGEPVPMTLRWLCADYVDHQVYHLSQILGEVPGVLSLEGNRYK